MKGLGNFEALREPLVGHVTALAHGEAVEVCDETLSGSRNVCLPVREGGLPELQVPGHLLSLLVNFTAADSVSEPANLGLDLDLRTPFHSHWISPVSQEFRTRWYTSSRYRTSSMS